MDITAQLQECFAKLGYFRPLPGTLISNPSTIFLWQQLVNNVKPKDEVDKCRKNIIINRLLNKNVVKESIQYSIPEIQVYNKLKEVNEEIAKTKIRIEEKKNKAASLRNSNRTNYLMNKNLKEKIEEKKIRLYALKKKSRSIENEIDKTKKVLKSKNMKFVAEETCLAPEMIKNSLQNNMEIIEKLLDSNSSHKHQNSYSNIPTNSKTCYSTIKKNKTDVRSIQKFGSCSNLNSVKCLFMDNFKENEINTGNTKNKAEISFLDKSGDLLPESCFDFKGDEEFLTSPPFPQVQKNFDELFTENSSELDDTISCVQSSNFQPKKTYLQNKIDYLQLVSSDNTLNQNIEEMYEQTNKLILWQTLQSVRENIVSEIRVNVANESLKLSFNSEEEKEEDFVKLKFICVKNSLLSLKCKRNIKKLNVSIKEKKFEFEKRYGEAQLKILEQQLEIVKNDTVVKLINKELKNFKKSDTIAKLNSLNMKIDKAKQELFIKIEKIGDYIDLKKNIIQKMKETQNESFLCVKKNTKLICSPEWATPLTEKFNLVEMNTFNDFPLNYNRKFFFTEKEKYFRDFKRNIIIDDSISGDTLYLISSIVRHPQYPPERILSEALRNKNKLKVLSELEFPKSEIQKNTYSLEELEKQESYVDETCDILISQMKSMKSNLILNSSSQLKTTMNLWLEMPFRNFISEEKEVGGKKYKDYEKEIEILKKNR